MTRPLLCVALVSCVPAPVDYTGKLCDPPMHGVPRVGTAWTRSAPGTTAATNGDFENAAAGWETSGPPLSFVTGHVGNGARLTGAAATAADVTLHPTQMFATGNEAATYCLAAWLAGPESVSATLVMQTTDEIVGTTIAATLVPNGGQTRLSRFVDPQKQLSIQIAATLSSSDALVVDDVVLWRSPFGTCSER